MPVPPLHCTSRDPLTVADFASPLAASASTTRSPGTLVTVRDTAVVWAEAVTKLSTGVVWRTPVSDVAAATTFTDPLSVTTTEAVPDAGLTSDHSVALFWLPGPFCSATLVNVAEPSFTLDTVLFPSRCAVRTRSRRLLPAATVCDHERLAVLPCAVVVLSTAMLESRPSVRRRE